MSIRMIASVDGDGLQRLREAKELMKLPEYRASIEQEAVQRFKAGDLQIGQLVCAVGIEQGSCAHKVFEIHEETVVMALPDMVMKTVPKSVLYDPNAATDIFWERV